MEVPGSPAASPGLVCWQEKCEGLRPLRPTFTPPSGTSLNVKTRVSHVTPELCLHRKRLRGPPGSAPAGPSPGDVTCSSGDTQTSGSTRVALPGAGRGVSSLMKGNWKCFFRSKLTGCGTPQAGRKACGAVAGKGTKRTSPNVPWRGRGPAHSGPPFPIASCRAACVRPPARPRCAAWPRCLDVRRRRADGVFRSDEGTHMST